MIRCVPRYMFVTVCAACAIISRWEKHMTFQRNCSMSALRVIVCVRMRAQNEVPKVKWEGWLLQILVDMSNFACHYIQSHVNSLFFLWDCSRNFMSFSIVNKTNYNQSIILRISRRCRSTIVFDTLCSTKLLFNGKWFLL